MCTLDAPCLGSFPYKVYCFAVFGAGFFARYKGGLRAHSAHRTKGNYFVLQVRFIAFALVCKKYVLVTPRKMQVRECLPQVNICGAISTVPESRVTSSVPISQKTAVCSAHCKNEIR